MSDDGGVRLEGPVIVTGPGAKVPVVESGAPVPDPKIMSTLGAIDRVTPDALAAVGDSSADRADVKKTIIDAKASVAAGFPDTAASGVQAAISEHATQSAAEESDSVGSH